MIINEVLNYAVLNVKRMDKESLVTVLAKFYHEDELFTAKSLLCKHVSELQSTVDATLEDAPTISGWSKLVNGKGAPIARKSGDPAHRRRSEAEDLMQMLILLDVNKVELPKYVSYDLDRVPSSARSVDSASPLGIASEFATLMSSFRSSMEDMLNRVERSTSEAVSMRLDAIEKKLASSPPDATPPVTEPVNVPDVPSTSWADQARSLAVANPNMNTRKPTVRVHGRASASSEKVKGVPRQLVCCASRLHLDVTEDDLTTFLQNQGILDVKCRKLKANDGRQFRTSAFRVSCSSRFESLFYNEAIWPEGAELRDWVFYNNRNGSN